MPRDRTGERARNVLRGLCKEAIAFKKQHSAGRVAAKQLKVVNELQRMIDPPGLGQHSFLHVLRWHGSDEQKEAVQLVQRLIREHGSAARRRVASARARRAGVRRWLESGGNGKHGGKRRSGPRGPRQDVAVPLAVREVRKHLLKVKRVIAEGRVPTPATSVAWQQYLLRRKPFGVNSQMWKRAQSFTRKAIHAGEKLLRDRGS